jgi:hypothetical protein
MTSQLILCAAVWMSATWVATAQPQPATPAQKAPPPPAAPAQPLPTIDPGYVYEPAGRRDPFISLVGRGGSEAKPGAPRPPGLAGLLIGEVTVKGVLRDRSSFIAMLQGPDKKTYNVRVGDKLLDGSVKSITPEQVIFSQDVNDPLSLVKQREVPKPVRQAEERG